MLRTLFLFDSGAHPSIPFPPCAPESVCKLLPGFLYCLNHGHQPLSSSVMTELFGEGRNYRAFLCNGDEIDLEDFPFEFVMLECFSAWISACVTTVRRESWRNCYTPKLPHDSLSEHIFSHFLKHKGFHSSHRPYLSVVRSYTHVSDCIWKYALKLGYVLINDQGLKMFQMPSFSFGFENICIYLMRYPGDTLGI